MQLKFNYHGSLGDWVDLVGLDLGPYDDQNLVPKKFQIVKMRWLNFG